MKEMLHILIRVSTSIQEDLGTSLKTQKEIGIELANKLGMSYIVHNEGGASSSKDTLENRPVMLKLLKMMDDGLVKNLYVWNTDRLSRNQITWYTIRQKMVKNGVVLYTSNGVHDTQDFMENMILGILSEVSQYDNKVRSERSRLGKIEMVKRNYWRGGDCPFGYKLENDGKANRLVENKDESKWIQFIYANYANGITLKEIKAVLQQNGIRTRRNNVEWSMGSLQVILRNEIYLGFDSFKDKKTNIIIKNNISQLISNKLWDEVQERRKLKLLRKGQLNRSTNFYLFRDFLICKCGTPMGGRIKRNKAIQHYYCPLSERKFNNSNKNDINCTVKKCLNIPATDEILWNKIINILSDTIRLSDELKKKTLIGKNISSLEMQSVIEQKENKILELKKSKIELEKGFVKIEADNILNKYPSKEIFIELKKELTKRYNKVLRDIDDIRNSLKQIGNDEMWFKWIELFGKHIQNSRDISKQFKKELLNVILESIIVDYNHDEKVHKLQINFKIPVHIINSNGEHTLSPLILSVVPPKAGRKSKDQNCTFPNYSTVTDFARFLG
jgi:DNA invertase Pin-like site-specific DNA recombinase